MNINDTLIEDMNQNLLPSCVPSLLCTCRGVVRAVWEASFERGREGERERKRERERELRRKTCLHVTCTSVHVHLSIHIHCVYYVRQMKVRAVEYDIVYMYNFATHLERSHMKSRPALLYKLYYICIYTKRD